MTARRADVKLDREPVAGLPHVAAHQIEPAFLPVAAAASGLDRDSDLAAASVAREV